MAACRALLRGGSRSFHLASRLLPRAVGEPAAALYGFCRFADDAVDEGGGEDGGEDGGDGVAALARLHERLDRAYAGRPHNSPIDRAFADVVHRHAIPRALPESLLEGFAWDAEGRRYSDLSDLTAYAARVAGSVGAMMAVLMGARGADAVARACDLGVAMQFSNIARDVGQDARAGRLYLPLHWLAQEGIDAEAFLADPVFSPALGRVVRRLLTHAEALYVRADSGIALLPRGARPGIRAARTLYAAIGHQVACAGYDSVRRRAVVPAGRKLALLAGSVLAFPVAADGSAPPLPELRYLVEAVAAARPPAMRPALRGVERRVAWVVELFARLEQRERMEAL